MGRILAGVENSVLEAIKRSDASSLERANKLERELLKSLKQVNPAFQSQLDSAIESAVLNEAKRAISWMQKTGGYADHSCVHPEYLAYAIKYDLLSWCEKRIVEKHLDEEKSLDEFCSRYSPDKVAEFLGNNLLNPEMAPEVRLSQGDTRDYDPHPVCLCH